MKQKSFLQYFMKMHMHFCNFLKKVVNVDSLKGHGFVDTSKPAWYKYFKKKKKVEEKNVWFFWIQWDSCPQSPCDYSHKYKTIYFLHWGLFLLKKVHRVVQINTERIEVPVHVRIKKLHHDMLFKIVLLCAGRRNYQ